MPDTEQYCFTAEEFISKMNRIKDHILEELKNDNIISPETQKTLSKSYFITLAKPSWVSKFLKIEEGNRTNIVVTKLKENTYEENPPTKTS